MNLQQSKSDFPERIESIDEQRRRFLLHVLRFSGGLGIIGALVPFVSSCLPSAKTRDEAGPVCVDVSHLKPGQQMTVMWCGKPVWIIYRTAKMLAQLSTLNVLLRDPDSKVQQQPSYATNPYRSIKPEYLVLVGICTHLGCTPLYKPNQCDVTTNVCGEFYCPCHGSRFDLSGRVFKNVPAPINLEVPPYRFIDAHRIQIGEEV